MIRYTIFETFFKEFIGLFKTRKKEKAKERQEKEEKTMPERIIKYRRLIVILAIAITVLAGLMLPRLEINPDLDKYVPDHIENKAYLKELNSIFGSTEMILVMLHADDVVNAATLERLRALSKDLCQVEGIYTCVSPFDAREISYDDGFMLMDPLLEEESLDASDYESLKTRIAANPMASRFFSEDFSLVSMLLTKKNGYSRYSH